jgi:hypothetical protein
VHVWGGLLANSGTKILYQKGRTQDGMHLLVNWIFKFEGQ